MLRHRKRMILRPGPWAFERPRVLIEHAEERVALRHADTLRRAGFSVGVCRGPSGEGQRPERCVLTTGEPCAFVDGADVVVSALGVEEREKRAVLEALRRFHPSKPLVVEVSAGEIDRYGDLINGVHLVISPVVPEELVAAVNDARHAPRVTPEPAASEATSAASESG
jgi:DNA-binding response OmpR family regulator